MPKCVCGHEEIDHRFYTEACVWSEDCDCLRYSPQSTTDAKEEARDRLWLALRKHPVA